MKSDNKISIHRFLKEIETHEIQNYSDTGLNWNSSIDDIIFINATSNSAFFEIILSNGDYLFINISIHKNMNYPFSPPKVLVNNKQYINYLN